MEEQILLYGVCTAISFAAVAVTSLVKLIICGIAKRCGKDLSGNAKEYIFTPMAILIAAAGLFFWLDKYYKMALDEKFILIVGCFSIGTMLLYLLLFQPTRKFAMKIIRAVAKQFKVPAVVETVKGVLTEAEILLTSPDEDLQSTANENYVLVTEAEKPPDEEQRTDAAAEKLRAMVNTILSK